VGLKLVAEEDQYPKLLSLLAGGASCRVLEEERHTGNYNAINLRVAHYLPRDRLRAMPPSGRYLRVLSSRGFSPESLEREYQEFMDSAEDHVLLEIIVCNFQELLESEIGRCMHEDRVLSQRGHLEYHGDLASSVRYLMNYMFTLCLAPGQPRISDVPIKLWARYMPDTMDRLIRDLFNVPSDASFDDYGRDRIPSTELFPVAEDLRAG
jgi:hypothetical protein